MTEDISLESAMRRLKQHVYKNRIRVKEFLMDFDKLNSGYCFPNHFRSALRCVDVWMLDVHFCCCCCFFIPRAFTFSDVWATSDHPSRHHSQAIKHINIIILLSHYPSLDSLHSMAGIDRYLSAKELELICETYKVRRDPTLVMVDIRSFLHEVELVFTISVS